MRYTRLALVFFARLLRARRICFLGRVRTLPPPASSLLSTKESRTAVPFESSAAIFAPPSSPSARFSAAEPFSMGQRNERSRDRFRGRNLNSYLIIYGLILIYGEREGRGKIRFWKNMRIRKWGRLKTAVCGSKWLAFIRDFCRATCCNTELRVQ